MASDEILEMTTPVPLISIIIPVYNGSNFLHEAIDSALAQTYPNCEVLVINDGSCDDGATEKIALSYGNRIHYFTKENGGVASALNMGIARMQGDFFCWLSHDDVYLPDKCQKQMDFWQLYNDKRVIVYSDVDYIDAAGTRTRRRPLPSMDQDTLFCIWGQSFLNGCSMLIPRELLLEQKGFKEYLPLTQDYDLWLRLASTSSFRHLSEVVLLSRQHAGQDSKIRSKLHQKECVRLFISYIPQLLYCAREVKGGIWRMMPLLAQALIHRVSDYGLSDGRDFLREFRRQMTPDEWQALWWRLTPLLPKFFLRILWVKSPENWRQPIRQIVTGAENIYRRWKWKGAVKKTKW